MRGSPGTMSWRRVTVSAVAASMCASAPTPRKKASKSAARAGLESLMRRGSIVAVASVLPVSCTANAGAYMALTVPVPQSDGVR
jgi:hypothetical protein